MSIRRAASCTQPLHDSWFPRGARTTRGPLMAGRCRPALLPSGKASAMTRQIALGAVIAFAVTVLALSVWEPRAIVAVAPVPVAIPAPVPAPLLPTLSIQKPLRPMMLRPETINRSVRHPVMMMEIVDGGAPTP